MRLVESVNPDLEQRLRDWIVQQAGGIPGVLVEAALAGEELHRGSGSLRKQLSQKFSQSLQTRPARTRSPSFRHFLLWFTCELVKNHLSYRFC